MRSMPTELLLRHTRVGGSSSDWFKLMTLMIPRRSIGNSMIGQCAEWLTASPANRQASDGTGFPWLSQKQRTPDCSLTQWEEDRISAATETHRVKTSWNTSGKVQTQSWKQKVKSQLFNMLKVQMCKFEWRLAVRLKILMLYPLWTFCNLRRIRFNDVITHSCGLVFSSQHQIAVIQSVNICWISNIFLT